MHRVTTYLTLIFEARTLACLESIRAAKNIFRTIATYLEREPVI